MYWFETWSTQQQTAVLRVAILWKEESQRFSIWAWFGTPRNPKRSTTKREKLDYTDNKCLLEKRRLVYDGWMDGWMGVVEGHGDWGVLLAGSLCVLYALVKRKVERTEVLS